MTDSKDLSLPVSNSVAFGAKSFKVDLSTVVSLDDFQEQGEMRYRQLKCLVQRATVLLPLSVLCSTAGVEPFERIIICFA